MRMDNDMNKGQVTQSGDIHNTRSVAGEVNTNQRFNGPVSGGVAGHNIITYQGEIHFHVTLASDELLATLTDLLKLATSGKLKSSC